MTPPTHNLPPAHPFNFPCPVCQGAGFVGGVVCYHCQGSGIRQFGDTPPAPDAKSMSSMNCRLCGKAAHEIGGYLHRVNEKGVEGIWECRPSCDVKMIDDERVMAAIEGSDEP